MLAQRPLGVDVSSYQGGSINWSSAKSAGISFAWAKATEGTYYYDADFTINEVNAKSAGVYIGAYHFARPDLDVGTAGADTEAAYFWNHAKNYLAGGDGRLVPMLDFETSYGSGASMSAWINEWCQAVKNYAAANGAVCNPVVYTDGSIASSLSSPATDWPLDIADPTCGNPQSGGPGVGLGPWGQWTFWQYCWTGSVSGIGTVDQDVLNGSASTLQLFLITTSGTSAGAGVAVDWDPGAKKASPGSGGAGTWNNGTANWWLSGTGDVAYSSGGDYADFAGTAGTVTLGASVEADAITFDTAGYVISGSDTLTLNSPGNINVVSGSPTYIECVLGGVGYNLSGGGILVLNNGGNFSGSGTSAEFIIGPGTTLVVNSDHAVGNSGVTLNLQNGGIYQDNDTTNGDQFLLPGSAIALLVGGGVFDNPNASLSMTNYITGPGSLTTIGTTYTLTLTDTGNNYTGGTIVQSGTLKANAAGVLGATTNTLIVSGGTLDLNGASHTAGAVTISGGTLQNGTLTGSSFAGQSGSVSAVLAGSGAMTQTTSGTLTITGANTYSGGTTIGGGGVYCIAADSALGSSSGALTLNGGCLKNNNSSPTLGTGRTITLGASGGYVDAGWAPTNPITINSKITGSGQLLINMDGSPVILKNSTNNYTGDTIIGTNGPGYYSSGTQAWLKLGVSSAIPNGSGVGNVVIHNTYKGLLDLAGFTQTINGLSGDGIVNNSTGSGSLTIGDNNQTSTFSGVIENTAGTLTLTKIGTGAITLSGVNTYTGSTTISAGTLAVGSGGSINNTPGITLAAGATFDVSAIASYALSSSTSLSAGGTASAATIKGGTTVNLGSRPITLTYDGSHPALTISQGTLSLNGNSFTINGSVLPPGTYTLIQQASGSVSASGSFAVSGTAISGAGKTFAIAVTNGNVNLVVTGVAAFSNLTPSPSITYGAASVTLGGTVSATGPTYPTNGEIVTVTINGNAQTTTINDNTGDFSIGYNPGTFPASASPYGITYSYAGDSSLTTASDTSKTLTVNARPVILTGTRAFDGTATAAAAILSVTNKVGGDVVTVVSGNASLVSSNVGVEAISSVGTLALGGAAATNYTLAGASGSVTITANSVPPFSITSGSVDVTGSNFILTWQSVPGATYHVLASTNPLTAVSNWPVIAGPITATGTNTSLTNPMISPLGIFDVESP